MVAVHEPPLRWRQTSRGPLPNFGSSFHGKLPISLRKSVPRNKFTRPPLCCGESAESQANVNIFLQQCCPSHLIARQPCSGTAIGPGLCSASVVAQPLLAVKADSANSRACNSNGTGVPVPPSGMRARAKTRGAELAFVVGGRSYGRIAGTPLDSTACPRGLE